MKIVPTFSFPLSRFLLSFLPVITSFLCTHCQPRESAHVPAETENSDSLSTLLAVYQCGLCNYFAFGLSPLLLSILPNFMEFILVLF